MEMADEMNSDSAGECDVISDHHSPSILPLYSVSVSSSSSFQPQMAISHVLRHLDIFNQRFERLCGDGIEFAQHAGKSDALTH